MLSDVLLMQAYFTNTEHCVARKQDQKDEQLLYCRPHAEVCWYGESAWHGIYMAYMHGMYAADI
jgi:hypothetical protein